LLYLLRGGTTFGTSGRKKGGKVLPETYSFITAARERRGKRKRKREIEAPSHEEGTAREGDEIIRRGKKRIAQFTPFRRERKRES